MCTKLFHSVPGTAPSISSYRTSTFRRGLCHCQPWGQQREGLGSGAVIGPDEAECAKLESRVRSEERLLFPHCDTTAHFINYSRDVSFMAPQKCDSLNAAAAQILNRGLFDPTANEWFNPGFDITWAIFANPEFMWPSFICVQKRCPWMSGWEALKSLSKISAAVHRKENTWQDVKNKSPIWFY